MANHRTPLAIVEASGRIAVNPARYRDREEPAAAAPLIPAGSHLMPEQSARFEWFRVNLYYLTETDRPLVELAARLWAAVDDGSISDSGRGQYIGLCGRLGCSPSDRTKVSLPKSSPARSRFA